MVQEVIQPLAISIERIRKPFQLFQPQTFNCNSSVTPQNRLYQVFTTPLCIYIQNIFSRHNPFYDVIAFPPLLQAYIPNYVLICACLCCSSIWLQRPAALHCTLPIPQSFSCQGTLPAYWLLPKAVGFPHVPKKTKKRPSSHQRGIYPLRLNDLL